MTKSRSFDGGPVGYKRPPAQHQFEKGHKRTGGRRKGQKNWSTIIDEVLNARVTLTENGEAREVSFKEALIRKAAANAIQGGVREIERCLTMMRRLDPRETKPKPLEIRFKNIEGDDW